jgi:type IV pilus assembly protein PilV
MKARRTSARPSAFAAAGRQPDGGAGRDRRAFDRLLGLAGLQASGLRVGQSSIHRSQAAQLAYDMVERMRVNFAHAAAYDLALNEDAPSGTTLAERDLLDWRLRLRSLPGGTGSVAVDGPQVTVVVQWDDRRGAGVLRGSSADDAALATLQAAQFQITAQLAD